MKTTRFLILSALATATLGLSSCVVDEGYPVQGRYAYVERPYYRDYSYGYGYGSPYRHYNHNRYDGYYRSGGIRGVRSDLHSIRADVHHAAFH